jgi:hypothetical protein
VVGAFLSMFIGVHAPVQRFYYPSYPDPLTSALFNLKNGKKNFFSFFETFCAYLASKLAKSADVTSKKSLPLFNKSVKTEYGADTRSYKKFQKLSRKKLRKN